jgi:hypothetical protein
MRAVVVAAALLLSLAGPSSAFDLQTKRGQVICDTMRAFEELTIAISLQDDEAIADMSRRGCQLPGAGLRMELIESYPDQTALLFKKLTEYTGLAGVPTHVERLASLAEVRLFTEGSAPVVGYTMLPVSERPAPPMN